MYTTNTFLNFLFFSTLNRAVGTARFSPMSSYICLGTNSVHNRFLVLALRDITSGDIRNMDGIRCLHQGSAGSSYR